MGTLAGFDTEVLETTLRDRFRLTDVAPLNGYTECRDLRSPAPETNEQVLTSFFAQGVVPLPDRFCHLACAEYIERFATQVDDIAYIFYLSDTERIAGTQESTGFIDIFPCHLGIEAVGRDRSYLEHMEDLGFAFEVNGKLDLHRTFDLLLRHVEQLLDDLRKGEGLELELRRKGHNPRSVGIARIDDPHVLAVVGRGDHFEGLKPGALVDRDTLEIDGIVYGSLEFFRAEREGKHGLLGLA